MTSELRLLTHLEIQDVIRSLKYTHSELQDVIRSLKCTHSVVEDDILISVNTSLTHKKRSDAKIVNYCSNLQVTHSHSCFV